jgi:hypothetical protein
MPASKDPATTPPLRNGTIGIRTLMRPKSSACRHLRRPSQTASALRLPELCLRQELLGKGSYGFVYRASRSSPCTYPARNPTFVEAGLR